MSQEPDGISCHWTGVGGHALGHFRQSQESYMPGIKRFIEEAAVGTDTNTLAPAAKNVKLWLPLQIPVKQRKEVATDAVYKGELHLRKGQLIGTVGDAIRSSAAKYQRAYEALMSLGGEEHYVGFKLLLDADLILLNGPKHEHGSASGRRKQLKDSFKTLWGHKQTEEKDNVLADSVFVLSRTFSGAAELSGSDSSESEAMDEEQSDCDMSS
ncbi:hypothetical protein ARMSODRAFT_970052 [Armillaria solidipes]|uniref:Uncharacterized protein n=1 Tax=Armillaria solidipes TaxID=1076256 RepID=A0A2H3CGW0_9AGAR|nr:hypothetical protein ARMSODRAFT_970052 [Armillaria solidipes]